MAKHSTFNNHSDTSNSVYECYSKVLNSYILNDCDSKYHISLGHTGPLITKIPVVLSSIELQIDLESKLNFNKPIRDIKTIDKHINIIECKLIPYTNKIFIEGYIEKSIQYSISNDTKEISEDYKLQHSTINIPFKCVTTIKFARHPVYGGEYSRKLGTSEEDVLIENKDNSWIYYNKSYEPIYHELDSIKIIEPELLAEEDHTGELISKTALCIRLKLLQNQQVFIPELDGDVTLLQNIGLDYDPEYNNDAEEKYSDIEIGFDPNKGMIARKIPDNNFSED